MIPKLKSRIRFRKHRKIEGVIKHLIILRDVKQWYVCVVCEQAYVSKLDVVKSPVGIDLGLKDFAMTSDGEVIKSPDYSRYEKRIIARQRQLSRKTKGSRNREKARVKLAIAHQRLRFARHDFLHKASSSITKNYDVVCMENLNVSGMVKNHCLARSISSQGWYTFKQMLKYKMERKSGYMLEVDRFYPSTKTCNRCGWVQDMGLKERVYHCQNCGFEIDRDLNAAMNIRDEAMKQIRQELPEFKPVENPTPGSQMFDSRRDPMKQEAIAASVAW
jgi:putative transposase